MTIFSFMTTKLGSGQRDLFGCGRRGRRRRRRDRDIFGGIFVVGQLIAHTWFPTCRLILTYVCEIESVKGSEGCMMRKEGVRKGV